MSLHNAFFSAKLLTIAGKVIENSKRLSHYWFGAHHGTNAVLAVEDNFECGELLRHIFEPEVSLVLCTSAEEAIERLRRESYGLVLMDISLGGLSGVDALLEIRKLPHCKSLPVFALTAHAMKGDRERLLGTGFTHYISKPYNVWELRALVFEQLNLCALA